MMYDRLQQLTVRPASLLMAKKELPASRVLSVPEWKRHATKNKKRPQSTTTTTSSLATVPADGRPVFTTGRPWTSSLDFAPINIIVKRSGFPATISLPARSVAHTYACVYACGAVRCGAVRCRGAVPCRAVPCGAVPCHAVPCRAMLFGAVRCHAVPRRAAPCLAVPACMSAEIRRLLHLRQSRRT